MPNLTINTTAQFTSEEAKTAFLQEISLEISSHLGKPNDFMMVTFNHSAGQVFAGSTELAAFCELSSIGKITVEGNPALATIICGSLQKHLSIDPSRIYITFHDLKGANWGWNNQTFSFIDK